jgi:hypothetical protein
LSRPPRCPPVPCSDFPAPVVHARSRRFPPFIHTHPMEPLPRHRRTQTPCPREAKLTVSGPGDSRPFFFCAGKRAVGWLRPTWAAESGRLAGVNGPLGVHRSPPPQGGDRLRRAA